MSIRSDPPRPPVTGWHLSAGELRRYRDRDISTPVLWSVEAHLISCARCRAALAALVDPAPISAGWARLDAELDVPVPGGLERWLVRLGVPEHVARLLAATPTVRGAWLLAVAVTFVLALAGAAAAAGGTVPDPAGFVWAGAAPVVLVAPLLTLVGVAVSFGPRVDPAHLLCLVAPMSTFQLLLIRTAAVLVTTSAIGLVVAFVLPVAVIAMVGWLLPCLAVTSCALALTPRWGLVRATAACAAAWVGAVLPFLGPETDAGWSGWVPPWPAPVSAPGQVVLAVVAVLGSVLVWRSRHRFDVDHG